MVGRLATAAVVASALLFAGGGVAFAQDEWKLRSNMTLSYGLRYDYYTPLSEVDTWSPGMSFDAAFCSAHRVTLAGSMTPAATRSSNVSVAAL